ncbi:MAG: DNA repair protein RecO [Saprospiraceae bacterium]|nr:DNA repair protein RecO [Saprospiraceae bacterium]
MLYKTKGIVIHQIKYSETSVIVKIYTELFGLKSYILRGVRKNKSKIKSNILQPLTLVELDVYNKEKSDIQQLREIRNIHQFVSLPFEIHKSSIALFIAEILYKSIKEEEPNKNMFEFIFNSIIFLDTSENKILDFHLLFALQLTRYLGFHPQGKYSETNGFFDMEEGIFKSNLPRHPYFIDKPLSENFYQLIISPYENLEFLKISNESRKLLLDKIIQFYKLHLPGIKDIKSHHILAEVLC